LPQGLLNLAQNRRQVINTMTERKQLDRKVIEEAFRIMGQYLLALGRSTANDHDFADAMNPK
jgi:hypothetical protein